MSRDVEELNRRLLRARDAMDRAYAQPLDVRAVAAVAHLSAAQFIRNYRATFGETPHRYLQRRRIERSMFLLSETARSVTDICFDVGFGSLGTFSRTFSDIVGVTPPELVPALVRGERITEKAAAAGFDWPDLDGVLAKVREEVGELEGAIAERRAAPSDSAAAHDLHGRVEQELGDVLFALTNLGRHLQVHPEEALRGAVRRFESRFHHIEERLREQDRSPREATLAEMDRLWDEAKRLEKSPA